MNGADELHVADQARLARHRDLDETRRMLYMAMLVHETPQYELAGTLVNALVHHQHAGLANETILHILHALDGIDDDWLFDQIERITAELEGERE
jgi:hypothetical protein